MTRFTRLLTFSSSAVLLATGVALAQQVSVDINRISEAGVGDKIGTIAVSEGKGGVAMLDGKPIYIPPIKQALTLG